MSDSRVAWEWTDGGREEDGNGLVPAEDEEAAALRLGGEKDDMTEDDEEVPRLGLTRVLSRGDEAVAWDAGMLAIGDLESRGQS
jgi:hypothetical protein